LQRGLTYNGEESRGSGSEEPVNTPYQGKIRKKVLNEREPLLVQGSSQLVGHIAAHYLLDLDHDLRRDLL